METKEMMDNETVEVAVDKIEELTESCDSTKVAVITSLGAIAITGGIILYKKVIKPKVSDLKEKIATKKEEQKNSKSKDFVRVKKNEVEHSSK